MRKIGVGIVGVSAVRGWAGQAHIPALRMLSDRFDIRAVSATSLERAQAAALAFDAPLAFDDNEALCREPTVDLVVVTVKTPEHLALVSAAINAGKHVYCEWPLGRNLAEATQLASLARNRGVRAFIGLQARVSPEIRYLKDLIEDGYVGRILSTSIIASGRSWGPTVLPPSAYLLDRENGATMLSIPFGHAIDAMCDVLGEFDAVMATLGHGRSEVLCEETGAMLPMTSHDQVAVCGSVHGGVVASVHFRGGLSQGLNFHWEINGDAGDLIVKAGSGHIQMSELSIYSGRNGEADLSRLETPETYDIDAKLFPEGPSQNVGALYARIADDLVNGVSTAPTFEIAVRRHRMLDAIEQSATTGKRVVIEDART